MLKWYETVKTERSSNYISSRIRLARNWQDYRFSHRLSAAEATELIGSLKDGLSGIGETVHETFTANALSEFSEISRAAMRERRLFNSGIASKKAPVGLIVSESEDVSIVLNGDDHIRMQFISPNMHLNALWDRANRVDDFVNERFPYAFDDKYGYLTTYPTNVGTGMRANIVLHLPALSQGKQFQNLLDSITRFGVTIRGVYGEGQENCGALYDVSNAKTLGLSEKGIIDLVTKAASELNSQENLVRRRVMKAHPLERADEAWRAYGILKNARRLSLKEALRCLSRFMSGVADGVIRVDEPDRIYSLYLGVQPSNLLLSSEGPADRNALDKLRADYIRGALPHPTEENNG